MRTDEETGRDIWDKHQGNTPQFNPSHADWYAALTRAAREVLAQERAEVALDPHGVWPPEARAKIGEAAMKIIIGEIAKTATGHDERRAQAASSALFNWMDLPPCDQTALFDRVAAAIAASDAAAGYVLVPGERIQAVIKSIKEADPDVLTDTLWMTDCPAETVVDALGAMIEAAVRVRQLTPGAPNDT